MNYEIEKLSYFSTARIITLIYLIFGIIAGMIYFLSIIFLVDNEKQGEEAPTFMDYLWLGVLFILGMPLVYGVFVFIGTLLFVYLYNLFAPKIGGISMRLNKKKL